ncbi:MAG: threonine synthase [Methanomassiliicoccales archaeon]
MKFRCIGCGEVTEHIPISKTGCPNCGDLLEWLPEERTQVSSLLPPPQGFTLWRYDSLLPRFEGQQIVTLSEGGTPLAYANETGSSFSIHELFLKLEGMNPTGSFKDRGMTVAYTAANALGYSTAICASTGNTASSMAAYGAKAGFKTIVLLPAGMVAGAKLRQAAAFGASIIGIKGNFDAALETVRNMENKEGIALMNSLNPFRIEGQKTAAFEICDQLGTSPDWLIIPVGNGGNITSYWKGFMEFKKMGAIQTLPKMVAVQAEGAAPLAAPLMQGKMSPHFIERPETEASAIRIGKPVNWKRAMEAVRASGGCAVTVSDSEMKEARRMLAEKEGVLTELASASTIAALGKLRKAKRIGDEDTVVCVLTGNGLKDTEEVPEVVTADGKQELASIVESIVSG